MPNPNDRSVCSHGRRVFFEQCSQCESDATRMTLNPATGEDDLATREGGWVIERHIHSELHYWAGRGPDDWRREHTEALRFARRADAELMLSYQCGGIGRVSEHMWGLSR